MSMMYVAAGAAVLSTAIAGYSSYNQSKGMEDQAKADANASLAQGRVEAERIRREKEKAQSTARAALAGNGLDVHEGTSIVINDEIERSANYDAAMSEIAGFNTSQRLKAEASVHKNNANAAAATGVLNTVSAMGSFKGKQGDGAKNNNSQGGWK
ncbi:hypothetical protein [Acinetobacter terrae]|uniref:Uncharacterized protein n=1 Tax=Acinetobacter terrae TaxID=2731247 RepID=A0A4R0ERB9_9GAMM|nr:hypothetical protein [Acinetobacter terrae]TCB62213.1 hypothetical protein E0H85_01440 [Acinetobacter terrae]